MSWSIRVSREPVQPPFEVKPKETWWRWEIERGNTLRAAGYSCGRRISGFRAARAARERLALLASGDPAYVFHLNPEKGT